MDYYKKQLYLARVDKNDQILGRVERWEAHQKAVLHRGIHLAVFFQDKIILQQRRHPAFNGYFDITIASHPLLIGDKLQDDLTALYTTLNRELNLEKADLISPPQFLGKFHYQAKNPHDPRLQEHEINHVYSCEAKAIPIPNYEFAYGLSVVTKADLGQDNNFIRPFLTPWTKKAQQLKLF